MSKLINITHSNARYLQDRFYPGTHPCGVCICKKHCEKTLDCDALDVYSKRQAIANAPYVLYEEHSFIDAEYGDTVTYLRSSKAKE